MRHIKTYISFYLLVYVGILAIYVIFQYCSQNQNLTSAFSFNKIISIITVTATVLTPIIAIIGFKSWRHQETYKRSQEIIESAIDAVRELSTSWHLSREHNGLNRFHSYCINELNSEYFDDLNIFQNEISRIKNLIMLLYKINFIMEKIYIYNELDLSKLDEKIENVENILNENIEALGKFQQQLIANKNNIQITILTEDEMYDVCNKLDERSYFILNIIYKDKFQDYSTLIHESMKAIAEEILTLKKQI